MIISHLFDNITILDNIAIFNISVIIRYYAIFASIEYQPKIRFRGHWQKIDSASSLFCFCPSRKMMDSGQLDFYQHSTLCTNTCRSTKFDILINNTRFPPDGTGLTTPSQSE